MSETSAPKLWPHIIADVAAIAAVAAFVILGKLDATYGVLFIALVVGLKMPTKGGGISTVLWPLLQLFRNGKFLS